MTATANSERLDTIVIGGGIVGLATAVELHKRDPDARILLIEKEKRLTMHQTGHNSGVIHAGVYYPPASLKARFCVEGNAATKSFCRAHGIDFATPGKVLVATDESERAGLEQLFERIAANGLEREWLDQEALRLREPNIRGVAGIFVPASGIVDYRAVGAALAKEIEHAGGEIQRSCEVTGIEEYASEIVVETTTGTFHAQRLVACAGLMADRLARMQGLAPDFMICPFRGEYYRVADARADIVSHLIYPVPDPRMPFLGVHLTPTVGGQLTVGPNAVLAWAREGYRKTDISLSDTAEMLGFPGIRRMLASHLVPGMKEMADSLFKRRYLTQVQRYCPDLGMNDLEPHPAGVRAQAVARDGTLIGDFLFMDSPRSLHVCNAPSPAATSALPIAAHIVDRLFERESPGRSRVRS